MKEIAVNRRAHVDQLDFEFWVRACEIQLTRDVYPAWKFYAPLGEMPCVAYADVSRLKPNSTHTIEVVDTIDDPNLAGYHSGIQAAGFAFGRSLPNSRVLSHEVIELATDSYCNLWHFDETRGVWIAREIADPVESDTYEIDVTIFGMTRPVTVSNFCYPAWYGMIGHGDQRLDHLGACSNPFEVRPGGYAITKDENKTIVNIYGATGEHPTASAKLMDPHSRTGRRAT